jgi:RNA polymerase sigma factor (sigma-70 family)
VDSALERDLVARLRRGDRSAFDVIYDALRPRVWSFLVRMTGRRDVADDLAQEVWLRLSQRGVLLAEDTRLAAWLFTVARNLYISQWRAAQVTQQLAGGLLPAAAPMVSPFESVVENQTAARIERAIANLPPAYREILLLCVVEAMAPRDAATVLGIKPEAARQRLARARTMIDAALADISGYAGAGS